MIGFKDIFSKDSVFKQIVEISDRPIIISSIEGKYLYINDAYLKIRNRDLAYFKDKYWWQAMGSEFLARKVRSHFDELIRKRELTYSQEYHNEGKENLIINWKSTIIQSKFYSEEIIVEFGTDVSEQRILESQLIHMQKLDSLGTLAGGIAHEFNNILTSIIGYSSFLKNLFEKGSKERGYVDKIQKASQGAAKLTSKLLGFARKGKYFEKLIDPNIVIKEVYEIINKTISKKINIELNLLSQKRFILADYDQIFQSIMNLVINANDAMEKGGKLVLSTYLKKYFRDTIDPDDGFIIRKGDYYAISVQDDGVGMDSALKKKIFEPFFTTKSEGKGTGLGMPMVYGVAKSHNGYLLVESEPGVGTTMTMLIPVTTKISLDKVYEDSGVFPIIKIKESKTILIVDADSQILEYLESVLIEYGYSIRTAANGEQAYQIFEEEGDVDLILMDLILQKMDCEEFINRIESTPNQREIKYIVMTDLPDDDRVRKMKLSGLGYFLFKPFKVSNLITLLRNIFDNKEI